MTLNLTATTPIDDLVIDFIEVRLASGKIVSLNWDASSIDREENKMYAYYSGLYFDTKRARRIRKLKGMRVVAVGLYSDVAGEGDYPISIDKMEFWDGNKSLEFNNVFVLNEAELKCNSAMQQPSEKFLAGSRR